MEGNKALVQLQYDVSDPNACQLARQLEHAVETIKAYEDKLADALKEKAELKRLTEEARISQNSNTQRRECLEAWDKSIAIAKENIECASRRLQKVHNAFCSALHYHESSWVLRWFFGSSLNEIKIELGETRKLLGLRE